MGSENRVILKKEVGLASAVSFIVGSMIGSGIFFSPVGVLRYSGSVGASLLIWIACGIQSMFGALCYAELGTLIRKSGSNYIYMLEALGPLNKFLGPIPAFLHSWVNNIILDPASNAVLAVLFSSYVTEPFFDKCGPPQFVIKMVAITCIFTVVMINGYSIKLATRVQIFFTVAKVLALFIIIVGGFMKLFQGETQHIDDGFIGTNTNPTIVVLAFYSGLWSYGGWQALNYITEEVKDVEKTLPRAIMIAVPLVTVVYFLTNVSYFTVMSQDEMLSSTAVAYTWGREILGEYAWIIPLSVAMSVFGCLNAGFFCLSRLAFAAAREGHLLDILAMIHVKNLTPIPSILLKTIVSIAVIILIPEDIILVLDYFVFMSGSFDLLTYCSLLVLRVTMRDVKRPYQVPLPIPIIMILVSLFLVILPIAENPRIEFLYAFTTVMFGLVFYIPFVYLKMKIPFFDSVTIFFQNLLMCSPQDDEVVE